jgi:hypothetical protein
MDRNFGVIFDHFELRVFHAETAATESRFAEDHQTLAGENHLLYVVQIEPAQDEGLTECMGIAFLQSGFENFPASAESKETCL